MNTRMKKISVLFLSISLIYGYFAVTGKNIVSAQELGSAVSTANSRLENSIVTNIKIFDKNFNEKLMTQEEKDIYNKILDSIVSSYSVSDRELVKKELKFILQGYMARDGFITTHMLADAVNTIIGVVLAPYGVNSINLLIAKMGEYQAKRLVRSVVVDAVRSQLFRIGLSGAANIWDQVAGMVVSSLVNPGGMLANAIDEHDMIPNNGRIELW